MMKVRTRGLGGARDDSPSGRSEMYLSDGCRERVAIGIMENHDRV